MTSAIDTRPARRPTASLALHLAIAAVLLLGTLAASARAADRRDDHWRHDDRRDWHGHGGYAPPPVVYGGPVYAPPPVVYGPGVGINIRIP